MPEATPETWAIVEELRAVVGFEGLYDVSSLGRIKRVGRAAIMGNGRGGGARVGHVRMPQRMKSGHYNIALYKDGRQYMRLVHVIVTAAFLGPCPDGKEVNHKRGREKWNNAVSNLEYMTKSENIQHAYDTGLKKANTAAAQIARRQQRVLVPCECGCGHRIETPDRKGRLRRFINGHQGRHARQGS